MIKKTFFYQAIREAQNICMAKDKSIVLLGLGVDDPKGIFGTTLNLHKKYKNRVFDMPTAENGFTGIALGLATKKIKPIIVHQRVEFSLVSFEQIVNQIAKWNYMSAGKVNVSMTIRLIIGKGWGQGPQHSQSLESLFAHIPGLKVVCPSSPEDAKGMMISSIMDKNPVIFFEHRWLHNLKSKVPDGFYKTSISKSKLLRKGTDIAIISFSNSLIESLKASDILKSNFNISSNVLDLRVLKPLDKNSILKLVSKIKNILIVDNGMPTYGVSAEVLSIIQENSREKKNIKRIGVIDSPIPSTLGLAKYCYPEFNIIIEECLKLLKLRYKKNKIPRVSKSVDQPDINFKGPF